MFFSKCLKFHAHFRNAIKNPKKSFIFEIMAFELVARNSAHCNGNTCYGQSTCQQTVLRFKIRLMQTSSNSIYPKWMEK